MGLTRLAIARPIIVLMTVAAILLLGLYGHRQMPTDLDPRVELPVMNVTVVYPGASPEQVEERVTRPLEEAVASLPGLRSINSTSLENAANVVLRFEDGADVNAALAEARARVEGARRDLPPDAAAPVVSRIDPNAVPIMVLGVRFAGETPGGTPDDDLLALTEAVERRVQPALGRVEGVATVRVVGGLEREVVVRARPELLEQHGVAVTELLMPLRTGSAAVPAGALQSEEREQKVRVDGEFRSLDEIRSLPLLPKAAAGALPGMSPSPFRPAPLLLEDVADVEMATRTRDRVAHVGGERGLFLQVVRLGEANTVQVVDRVRERLRELEAAPAGERALRIEVLQDQSEGIRLAMDDINSALVLGCLLAVLVVYLFLHSLRETLIVAIQLPSSIIATFGFMWLAGFSLNQMSMLALALAVGILIDDSILVLECIHRHRRMGKEPRQAALDGRAEIGLADATNTFLDVVVYLPVALMAGAIGMYFKQFGLTVAAASLFSLYLSFSITPMLASRWFRPGERSGESRTRFARRFNFFFHRLQRAYRGRLRWALAHRPAVLGLAFAALGAALALGASQLGQEFVPGIDRGEVLVTLEARPGSNLAATERVLHGVEKAVRMGGAAAELDAERMFGVVGEIGGSADRFPQRGPAFAQLTLPLREKSGLLAALSGATGRERSDEAVALAIRDDLADRDLPGLDRVTVTALRSLTGNRTPVALLVHGPEGDPERLTRAAGAVRRELAALKGPDGKPLLANVDTNYRPGLPELVAEVDRGLTTDLRVTPGEVGMAARMALEGNTDARFRQGAQVYPVRLQVDPAAFRSARELETLVVGYRGRTPVYLADVAAVRQAPAATWRLRRERRPMESVTAELVPGAHLASTARAIDASLDRLWAQDPPALRGIARSDVAWSGDAADMRSSFRDIGWSLFFAVALSYMLLAALFNSYIHPLMIMLTLPMALTGGVLGLVLTGRTLSVVSLVGMVMLIGLVGKNAILLIDYTNTLRFQHGMSREEALVVAGPVRLRPILMTVLSTVLSTLPVAVGLGKGAEIRAPMAVVVIGGLLLSTLLTLFVIPVAYTYADDFTQALLRRWEKLSAPFLTRRSGG